MITEIMKDLFMIEQPFPNRRVKSIDAIRLFLIRGQERWLLVDTGLNEPVYEAALRADLAEAGVDLSKMDLFVSHMHPDHCGLVCKFKTPDNRIYATREEADIINSMNDENYWHSLFDRYRCEGLQMDFDTFFNSYPPAAYYPEGQVDFHILSEGDIISIGDYKFRCLIMPGHGTAHGCLYDENAGILICCDMILSDVPPILFLDRGLEDPLGTYLRSLERLEKMDVKHLLPCHGELEFDLLQRSEELRQHYTKLCTEVTADLVTNPGGLSIHELADLHTKKTLSRDLTAFSSVSYWFFFIPILASVKYLAANGDITGTPNEDGVIIYTI